MFVLLFGNHLRRIWKLAEIVLRSYRVTDVLEPIGIDLEENVALGMGMWTRYEAGDCAIVVSIHSC